MSRRLDTGPMLLLAHKTCECQKKKKPSHDADANPIAPSDNLHSAVGYRCCAGCTGEVFSAGGLSCFL
jgi:hypothetical protein